MARLGIGVIAHYGNWLGAALRSDRFSPATPDCRAFPPTHQIGVPILRCIEIDINSAAIQLSSNASPNWQIRQFYCRRAHQKSSITAYEEKHAKER